MNIPCPQCKRISSKDFQATYTCRIPYCLQMRFCCPACMFDHLVEHIIKRDKKIEKLKTELVHLKDNTIKRSYTDKYKNTYDFSIRRY